MSVDRPVRLPAEFEPTEGFDEFAAAERDRRADDERKIYESGFAHAMIGLQKLVECDPPRRSVYDDGFAAGAAHRAKFVTSAHQPTEPLTDDGLARHRHERLMAEIGALGEVVVALRRQLEGVVVSP